VDQEWARLNKALSHLEQQGLMALEKLDEASLGALQRRLRRDEYHVFHFIGHGDFDHDAQDGVLYLEDEAGHSQPVPGQALGTLLRDHRSLRLATLNACEGARASAGDPFSGVAQSLVRQGIPAVIAMQFELSDEAATAFAHEFYAAVADSYPVDAALTEARKAIFGQGNQVEWAAPVLFMRAPEGMIWKVEKEETDMSTVNKQDWWDGLPDALGGFRAGDIGGKVTITTVGAGANNVAVGENITQIVREALGEPAADDKRIIEEQLAHVRAALKQTASEIGPSAAKMAQGVLAHIESELLKAGQNGTPNATTITQMGSLLLDSVPQIDGALAGLFATPAVGRVVGKAGEAAVNWVRERFGNN
jgi:hypothetical protein